MSSFSSRIVEGVLSSPLYYPIVGMAKRTMINTAGSIGLDWEDVRESLRRQNDDWDVIINAVRAENPSVGEPPEYFQKKFHGYSEGNLCLDSALEQEIASKAVGGRNFPGEGLNGENILRGRYDKQLRELGASLQEGDTIVDMGCGTGTSTRRLAALYPQASKIVGLDLSPYMIAVGRHLLTLGTDSSAGPNSFEWIEDISADAAKRCTLELSEIAQVSSLSVFLNPKPNSIPLTPPTITIYAVYGHQTRFEDGSVGLVSLCLVIHELPQSAIREVIHEAHRILRPGGVLAVMEMDPVAPGYVKLRANAALFSILRSTEPYLDEYFELAPHLPEVFY